MLQLKIIDLFKRTNINYWYKHFNNLKNKSRDEIIQYRNKKFIELINYVYDNVPFYADYMRRNKIKPCHINNVKDIKLMPIIDRDIIKNHENELISKKYKTNQLFKGSSSGTTGIPINYYQDKNGISAGTAAGYILWGLSGWKPGDRTVHIWGNSTSIESWKTLPSKLKNKLLNQINIASTIIDSENGIKECVNKIRYCKPKSIDGYTSSIFTIAKYLEKNKLAINRVNHVITTAENLEPYQRDLIEKHIGPTSDLYGSGEVLGIAIRPINDEKYYIFDPHVIVEAIDNSLKGMKDIVVTDLHNYGMPLIRYKIGDMIDDIFDPDEKSPYPFSYFNKIIGRSSDIINLPNGKYFHPVNIFGGTLFREFPGITRHKVIWDGMSLEFLFEAKQFDKFDKLNNAISKLIIPFDVPYSIKFTEKILPSTTGKYKYVEILKKGDILEK